MVDLESNVIRVYGTNWCGDCIRTKSFFSLQNISFEWINIDSNRDGEKLVYQLNNGMRRVPTILFPDGSILVEPTNKELAAKLLQCQKGADE